MLNHKLLASLSFTAILAFSGLSADAQWYSGSYTTYHAPYTASYGGGIGYGGESCCGTGSYTSYYGGGYGGGGYGNNPFAPLVSSPWPQWGLFRGFRGFGYTAGYAPYSNSCCSPCATNGCSTGNCGLTTNQPLKPTPDTPPTTNDDPPRTYDEENDMPPMDSPGFRPTDPEGTTENGDDFPGFESFKPPAENEEGGDTPANEEPPTVPLDANPTAIPNNQFDFDIPKPITPRNSAEYTPTRRLDHKITFRSAPVLVPERQKLATSRPLIVRKTVHVIPTKPLTIVSDSRPIK